jgi:bla regulator protein blaR1
MARWNVASRPGWADLTTSVAVAFAFSAVCLAQQVSGIPQWQIAAGGTRTFEVASVKPGTEPKPPNFPLTPDNSYPVTGGRISGALQLTVYIQFAYKLRLTPAQVERMIAHLPRWVGDEFFEIEAKGDPNATRDQMRLMMQSLLAERFGLQVHFENHEEPVLDLELVRAGKPGSGIQVHPENGSCDSPEAFPASCSAFQVRLRSDGTRDLGGGNVTMADLAEVLPIVDRTLGQVVVDRTGLRGHFDVLANWMPEPDPPTEPAGPTFRQALNDQLGMKLRSGRGSVRTLVVDHVVRPEEN